MKEKQRQRQRERREEPQLQLQSQEHLQQRERQRQRQEHQEEGCMESAEWKDQVFQFSLQPLDVFELSVEVWWGKASWELTCF
jgi:hypothetical protein